MSLENHQVGALGVSVGFSEGEADRLALGVADGLALGEADGLALREALGEADGLALGEALGEADGLALGEGLREAFREADGLALGEAIGEVIGGGGEVGEEIGVNDMDIIKKLLKTTLSSSFIVSARITLVYGPIESIGLALPTIEQM